MITRVPCYINADGPHLTFLAVHLREAWVGLSVLDRTAVSGFALPTESRRVVDLSELAGQGGFRSWEQRQELYKVYIEESGTLVWPGGV